MGGTHPSNSHQRVGQDADPVALLAPRMVGGDVDLDAVAAHADLDVEAAARAVAALGDDAAGDAAGPARRQIDVVRPEDERPRSVVAGGADLDRAVVEEEPCRPRCGRAARSIRR